MKLRSWIRDNHKHKLWMEMPVVNTDPDSPLEVMFTRSPDLIEVIKRYEDSEQKWQRA